MTPVREYEHLATESRRRSLAPIGFRVAVPDGVTVEAIPDGAVILRGEEAGERAAGGFEISIFSARLFIDPDGALAKLARAVAQVWADERGGRLNRGYGVTFESGVTGACAEVVVRPVPGQPRPPFSYLHVYALTVEGELGGGVLVQQWSAGPDWAAGRAMLDSLRIVPLRGAGAAGQGGFGLPLVK